MSNRFFITARKALALLTMGLCAGFVTHATQAADPLEVNVEKLRGEAFKKTGGVKMPLKLNQTLTQGDVVSTGATGDVILSFETGHFVHLGPLTVLRLAAAELDGENEKQHLFLETGVLGLNATPLATPGSQLQVETTNLVAGVRGTEFDVTQSGEGTDVDVLEGEVEVAGDGQREKLGPGRRLRHRRGGGRFAPQTMDKERLGRMQQRQTMLRQMRQNHPRFKGFLDQNGKLNKKELLGKLREKIRQRRLNKQGQGKAPSAPPDAQAKQKWQKQKAKQQWRNKRQKQ